VTTDLLANVERAESDRPPRAMEEPAPSSYWLGPAGALAGHWRKRALAAEAEVVKLRRALFRWRFKP